MTASLVARLLDVTFPTAQKAINDLQEQGILEEITGQRRNRFCAAPGVIEIAYGEPNPISCIRGRRAIRVHIASTRERETATNDAN